MIKKSDKRIHFIIRAINMKLTDNPKLANEWYINNHGEKMENTAAIEKFREWLK